MWLLTTQSKVHAVWQIYNAEFISDVYLLNYMKNNNFLLSGKKSVNVIVNIIRAANFVFAFR